MAFLRRGYVPHHYEGPPILFLQKLDGSTLLVPIERVQCFEEHSLPKGLRPFVTVYYGAMQTTVLETLEEISAKLAVKAVAHA